MKRISHFMSASGAFLKTLVKPSENSSGFSVNGHTILEGWNGAPEEQLIARCKQLQAKKAKQSRRIALYCFQGSHEGEVLFLGRSFETIGRGTHNSLVLTPIEGEEARRYQMMINGVRTLIAETGTVFKLNGLEEQQAELFDYDELEILGNKFIVLDVNSQPALTVLEKGGVS